LQLFSDSQHENCAGSSLLNATDAISQAVEKAEDIGTRRVNSPLVAFSVRW